MEPTHNELVQRGAKWLKNVDKSAYRCPNIVTELKTFARSIPDVFGFGHWNTVLIECKTNHADFLADFSKEHRYDGGHPGNFRFYLCPEGVIMPSEIPGKWGLLYCYDKYIRRIVDPIEIRDPRIREEEYLILYSLIRRASVMGLMPQILTKVDQSKIIRPAH